MINIAKLLICILISLCTQLIKTRLTVCRLSEFQIVAIAPM